MKAYKKAVLAVEEFILNADIADASTSSVPNQGDNGNVTDSNFFGGGNSVGVEFEINDEI